MVKSIILTLSALLLSIAFFIFVDRYLSNEFGEFCAAVDTLYVKTEDGVANREDAYAVKSMWTDKKSKLHMFIPHNDISYVDYWLNEACAFIYTGNYDLALSNLEVVREIAKSLPDNYTLKAENIF